MIDDSQYLPSRPFSLVLISLQDSAGTSGIEPMAAARDMTIRKHELGSVKNDLKNADRSCTKMTKQLHCTGACILEQSTQQRRQMKFILYGGLRSISMP